MTKRKNDMRKAKPKSKRQQPTPSLRILLFMLILCLAGIISFLSVSNTQPNLSETLIVPFNQIRPTYTEQAYSGTVRLVIEGSGQAGGQDYSDAFYLYAYSDGSPYNPPWLEHFDLEIDGQRAIYTLNLLDNPPAYNPDHIYTVEYDAGEIPRLMTFRISDSIVDDNTGQFRITVKQM